MSADEVAARVANVFSTVLGRRLEPGEEVSPGSDPGWDSLRQVELVFAIEDAFDIRFEQQELERLTSMEAFVASVSRHRAA